MPGSHQVHRDKALRIRLDQTRAPAHLLAAADPIVLIAGPHTVKLPQAQTLGTVVGVLLRLDPAATMLVLLHGDLAAVIVLLTLPEDR